MSNKYLIQLRSQLKETSRKGGWPANQFNNWWARHKSLHPRLIQKCFKDSHLSQDNPAKYQHWRVLKQVLDPHRQSIQDLMGKYSQRTIGTYRDPATYDQVSDEMTKDLISIIGIPAAADVFVQTYMSMAKANGQ